MIGQVKGYTNVFIFNVYLEDSHPFMLNKNKITHFLYFTQLPLQHILHGYISFFILDILY